MQVGVRGSSRDCREVMAHTFSKVWLWELLFGEGVAWRSPPSKTGVSGWSSVSVFVGK